MAISMGAKGHPDHGFGTLSGPHGHEAGGYTGVESAYGGAMIGPDSFGGLAPGIGPAGGYKGLAANAMKNMRGRQEMAGFLQDMSKKYGFDSVRNFITGYMGIVNAPMNPNMDDKEKQNAIINNAAQNYTKAAQNFNLSGLMFESPHKGFPVTNPDQKAYGLHGFGFSPMGFQGMNERGLGIDPAVNVGSSFNTGIFGPSQAELNAINQNQPSYAEQARNMNVAPSGFGPSQGLGYSAGPDFGELNR